MKAATVTSHHGWKMSVCLYMYIYIHIIYTLHIYHRIYTQYVYFIYFMFCVLQTVNMSCSIFFFGISNLDSAGRFGIPTAGCWMCIQMFPCWECCKVLRGKNGGNEIPSMCAYLFVYIVKLCLNVFLYIYTLVYMQ